MVSGFFGLGFWAKDFGNMVSGFFGLGFWAWGFGIFWLDIWAWDLRVEIWHMGIAGFWEYGFREFWVEIWAPSWRNGSIEDWGEVSCKSLQPPRTFFSGASRKLSTIRTRMYAILRMR